MQVECLSFNFSLSVQGGLKSLSILQKDEEQEAVGGQVIDGSLKKKKYFYLVAGLFALAAG